MCYYYYKCCCVIFSTHYNKNVSFVYIFLNYYVVVIRPTLDDIINEYSRLCFIPAEIIG